MRASTAVIAVLLVACGSPDDGGWHTAGECEPPPDGTALTTQAAELDPDTSCFVSAGQLRVIGSAAEWDALFDCTPPPIPADLDFATERAAIVDVDCSPIDFTFATDRAAEVVVGIHSHVSGACLGNILVVPLPQSAKPVRLAQCHDECGDECPPLPGGRDLPHE